MSGAGLGNRLAAQPIAPEALAAAFFARYSGTTLRTYRLRLGAFARWQGLSTEALPATFLRWGAPVAHAELERYRAHLRDDRRHARCPRGT